MGEPAMVRWTVAEREWKDAKVLVNATQTSSQNAKCSQQHLSGQIEDFLEGGSDEEAADDADDDEEGADGEESESTASEAQSPTWHHGIQHTGCVPHVSLNNNCDLSTLSSKLLTTCAIFTQFLPNYLQTVASMYTLLIVFLFFCYFNVFVDYTNLVYHKWVEDRYNKWFEAVTDFPLLPRECVHCV